MTARSNGNQRKDVGRFINGVGSRVDYEHDYEHEHEHEHRCAEHESQHVSRNESQNEKTPEQGRLLERSN
jgi:hypothetical protein